MLKKLNLTILRTLIHEDGTEKVKSIHKLEDNL